MKQVLIRGGRAVVEEMPVPVCGEREVLVRAAYSLISPGTEGDLVASTAAGTSGLAWVRRAAKLGELARVVRAHGVKDAAEVVRARLAADTVAPGYSLSGTVVEVGRGVHDLVPGQHVACAGAGAACHAEVVAVPRLLVAPVPRGLSLEHAAFVTLGAIALHGVRQADLRLGEVACVTGLGLVGQLAVALLVAAGARVVGIDIVASRVDRARALGLEAAVVEGRDDVSAIVEELSSGAGADAVLLCAQTDSSGPLRQAVRLVRRRGRIVVVGAVGLDLERAPLYLKEAELRISCSYGPGRYDPSYEAEGHDYPYGFVRWTENRNLEEFLRLAANGAVDVSPFLDRRFSLAHAEDAYAAATAGPVDARPLGVLLTYPGGDAGAPGPATTARIEAVRRTSHRGIGVALVGPGEFANAVHLPALRALTPAVNLRTVIARSPNSARTAAKRFGALSAATDLEEALRDDDIEVIVICTRHDLHADQATRALTAGKAVFLEKPAAVDLASLERLEAAVRSGPPFTLGFNRRFAPDIIALKPLLDARRAPLLLSYRVSTRPLPTGHWAHGREGGGRIIGEACHMIDLIRHLVGHPPLEHTLKLLVPPAGRPDLTIGDNFMLTCRYADGSLATLVYTDRGGDSAGKERIEAHWDGRTAVIDDFRGLTIHGTPALTLARAETDKGHRALLARFMDHVAGRVPAPIPIEEILETSRFAIALDGEARRESGH